MTLKTFRTITVFLWITCTALLLLPAPWALFGQEDPTDHPGIGYWHLLMFIALGLFFELSRGKLLSSWNCLNVLAVYGFATEVLQYFIPNRHFDNIDWIQNCTGAFLGIHLGVLAKWSFIPLMKALHFIVSKFKRKTPPESPDGTKNTK